MPTGLVRLVISGLEFRTSEGRNNSSLFYICPHVPNNTRVTEQFIVVNKCFGEGD